MGMNLIGYTGQLCLPYKQATTSVVDFSTGTCDCSCGMVKLVKNAKTHTAAPILIILFISLCFYYLLLRRVFEKVTGS